MVLNNGEIAAEGNDAFHKVAFFGDTGANRGYDSFDAALLLSVSSGLFSGFRPYRLTDPTIIGDIDFDGVIGPSDALLLAGHVVGFFLPQIPLLTGSVGPTDVIGEDPILSFATTANLVPGQSGETVLQIGLAFPDPNGINAMDITLRFDPLVFQFTAGDNPITIDGTSFFADYFSNSVNADGNTVYRIDTQNNLVIISLSSSNRLGAATDATRNVLKLRLPVKSDSPLGNASLVFQDGVFTVLGKRNNSLNGGGLVLTHMDGTFRVGPDNRTPTDLSLTPQTIAENQLSGTMVGSFTTSDPDTGIRSPTRSWRELAPTTTPASQFPPEPISCARRQRSTSRAKRPTRFSSGPPIRGDSRSTRSLPSPSRTWPSPPSR